MDVFIFNHIERPELALLQIASTEDLRGVTSGNVLGEEGLAEMRRGSGGKLTRVYLCWAPNRLAASAMLQKVAAFLQPQGFTLVTPDKILEPTESEKKALDPPETR